MNLNAKVYLFNKKEWCEKFKVNILILYKLIVNSERRRGNKKKVEESLFAAHDISCKLTTI